MRCDYAFLCDFAQQDPGGGKLHAIGIGWSALQAQSIPATHPQMSFVARLSGTVAEAGTKRVELRFIDADGANVIPPFTADMELAVQGPALEGTMNIVFNLNNVTLPKYGQYAFHLVVQGNEMARAPFSVVEPVVTN